MRMCVAAKPLLEKQGGAIVNIASIWSFFGGGLVPAYTASKGGVAQLTKALAVAWAPAIRVNAIAPGWIETELTKAAQADKARSDAIVSRTPFGRWGHPAISAARRCFCARRPPASSPAIAGGRRLYREIKKTRSAGRRPKEKAWPRTIPAFPIVTPSPRSRRPNW